jgi:hypothetical protein
VTCVLGGTFASNVIANVSYGTANLLFAGFTQYVAPWSARTQAAATMFKNELILVGGQTSAFQRANDVWAAKNFQNVSTWTQKTSTAFPFARFALTLSAFNE